MASSYDPVLVVLSIVIATIASYAALDLAGRVTASSGPARKLWLTGGAIAMGVGIWSMHFVGMNAFHLPVPVVYDLPTVILSLLAAVLASAVALWVSSRQRMGLREAVPAGLVMGAGIAAMHYIGMASMRMQADVHYDSWLVALSIAIAIVVAWVALWRAFALRGVVGLWGKITSVLLMGAAIPAMHYTGMAAARFTGLAKTMASAEGLGTTVLTLDAVVITTLFVLALAIGVSFAARRLGSQRVALEASEAARGNQAHFLREVIDANPHMVFVKDWNGRFTLANQAAADMYGTTPENLIGKTDADFNPKMEEVEHFLRDDREVIAKGKPRFVPEEQVTGATGATRWFQTIKVPLVSASGKHRQVVGVATDITERKLLEDQLRQAQKMEAIGRLAGGVAHDFNNLLTVILGYSDMLLTDVTATGVHADVQEIRLAAVRAAALTQQLLAFSRRQVLQPKRLDLNALVAGMHTLLRRLIGEDVELHQTAGAGLGFVHADPGQLEQVIMNLAVNARDAMPLGGALTIETANVELDRSYAEHHPTVAAGQYVMLAVTDTGTGMDAETRAHLFEPFFTTKGIGQGTGLGLATVHGIIAQTGGHVSVYSEPGMGTTFKVYLPRDLANPDAPAPVAPRAAPVGGAETVLVVEDEAAVQRISVSVLTKLGYVVLTANDGHQALDVAAAHPATIDIVVTDVVMPRMSGPVLAERLESTRPGIKVLYLSGYTDDAVVRYGVLEAGVSFLQKPFTPDALGYKVREVLDQPVATPAC